MDPISYFNALLADPRITILQILAMPRPIAVAQVYVPLRIFEERQPGYAAPASDEESNDHRLSMKLYHGNNSEEVEIWPTVDGVRANNWATTA